MRCIIVDIDGTIANNHHRVEHVQKSPKDWATYNSLMHLDTPIDKMVTLLSILGSHYSIILCSGRHEEYRQTTEAWLEQHYFVWEALYMRPDKDYRSDAIVKAELLDRILASGYEPQFVIDDRNSVVEMWRSKGLLCFQAAPGDF